MGNDHSSMLIVVLCLNLLLLLQNIFFFKCAMICFYTKIFNFYWFIIIGTFAGCKNAENEELKSGTVIRSPGSFSWWHERLQTMSRYVLHKFKQRSLKLMHLTLLKLYFFFVNKASKYFPLLLFIYTYVYLYDKRRTTFIAFTFV